MRLTAAQILADEDSLSDPISRAMLDSVRTSVRWEWMLQPPLRWSEPATTQATSAHGSLGGALPPQDVEVPDE